MEAEKENHTVYLLRQIKKERMGRKYGTVCNGAGSGDYKLAVYFI